MTVVAARILRVLTGDSPTAMLHAIDAEGHELRLEVPAQAVQAIVPGQLLVVTWSVHRIPEGLAAPVPAPLALREPAVELAEATPVATVSSPPIDGSIVDPRDDAERRFEALLGLTPGRRRGMNP